MAEDIQENLKTYKLQLQQVEASLTTDPDNEDLLKLKKDLQEVIDLTTELIVGKVTAAVAQEGEGGDVGVGPNDVDMPEHSWSVGDKCTAPYSEDGMYYEAVIDEIMEDGTCTITFENYGNTDITQVILLKPLDPSKSLDGQDGKPKSKKDLAVQQREYKRKKAQKKAQRMKMLEEEREQEKSKWQSFNAKTFSKTNKGRVKKSIFATPDGDKGKVGVGTCGVGGKPMTAYQHQEKWKK